MTVRLSIAGFLLILMVLSQSLHSETDLIQAARCSGGNAGEFPCNKVDLQSHITFTKLGADQGKGSNVWGFVDPDDLREYALFGYSHGTAIVDVTKPKKPVVVDIIEALRSDWREIKVLSVFNRKKKRYDSYAYVVTEAHTQGLQIIDLSELPRRATLVRSDHDVDASHTVFISNVDYATGIPLPGLTPYLYVMDSYLTGRGITIFSLKKPTNPSVIGHYDKRVHDMYAETITDSRTSQCAPNHNPCEILFGWHGHAIRIVDVTDKKNPVDIYEIHPTAGVGSHSGWISKDKKWIFSFDEGDEYQYGTNTLIRSFKITNLESPKEFLAWYGDSKATEHNGYVVEDKLYVASYTAGLKIFDIKNPKRIQLIGSFDTYPENEDTIFHGAWGVYPFLPSGNILISDIDRGLFILKEQNP